MTYKARDKATLKEDDDEVDFAVLLDTIISHKGLIAAITSFVVLLGALYAFMGTPVYEANILVQIEDNADPAGAAKNILGDISSMFDVKSSADAEIQLLGSRLVISRTVDEQKLYITTQPARFAFIGGWIARHVPFDGSSIPLLRYFAWGREKINVVALEVPDKLIESTLTLTVINNKTYRLAENGWSTGWVGQVGKTETFSSDNGPITINVASIFSENGVRFHVVRHSRQDTIEELQKQLKIVEQGKDSGVLSATLQDEDSSRLQAILNEIGYQYVHQNVERKSAQAATSLAFLNSQLPDMKKRLDDAEQRQTTYRNAHGIISLSEEAKVVLGQSADAEGRLATLEAQQKELLMRFGPSHPTVETLTEQIALARQKLGELGAREKAMPNHEQELIRLTRDVTVANDLYVATLSNIQQLELLKSGKIGNVRVVDTAFNQETPVKPNKPLVLLLSAALGLAAAIFTAVAIELLYGGVTDVDALEKNTGLSVYSIVPFSDVQEVLFKKIKLKVREILLLTKTAPEDPAIESLRSFRTSLEFAMLEASNRIVQITAPAPGMGKSFLSANLASVLAAAGKRVLLVDCDLRRGHLNQYFGLGRDTGLAELIAGRANMELANKKQVEPGLDFVSTGTRPINPSELLASSNFKRLLTDWSQQYDVVLLDSPPVLPVADSEVIASSAATVFLVARFGKTKIGELIESEKRLQQVGARVRGLIFNGVVQRSGVYAYGSKYGAYRYTSYRYEVEADH
ncbi:hypothetical protein A6V36_35740 [Paraburkholderia ginsengiterrae]|uniref:Putative tyrosine-protein kinase EpsB n=1 Tax=Paraburkholderia ginsengiterrae TaxID=1462993 RepID=A0A1A9N041_9BURK|nr:polysaccharide biosynthesis tyrosine autokinase [Paraburkholderia ginsengiterrae]OAJ53711.1 hypothetical protein A6V37_35305 [Paraburkholderia ginsengiterrae]OAJ54726.1 hypothetical protein A6V36_35740 [Paraburkholderia ginsengiterrae]